MALTSWALVRAGLAAVAVLSLGVACGVPEIQDTGAPDAGAGRGASGGVESTSGGIQGAGGAGGVDAGPPPDGTCSGPEDCASFPATKQCDTRVRGAGGAAGAAGTAGKAGAAGTRVGTAGMAGSAGRSGAANAGKASGGAPDAGTRVGRCVECVAASDCGSGRYCTDANACAIGCQDDSGCLTGQACDLTIHLCANCAASQSCPEFTTCSVGDGGTAGGGATDGGTGGGGVCAPTCTASSDCPVGWHCCGGQCKNVASDLSHCGACDQACTFPNAVGSCANGQCSFGQCDMGWGDCVADTASPTDEVPDPKGCETNLQTAPAHCGKCESPCFLVCLHGQCSSPECPAGRGDCDDDGNCETDVTTSVTNCGQCGRQCPALQGVATCSAGQCGFICDAQTNYADCDRRAENGCEAYLLTDVAHCSRCDYRCTNDHGDTKCVGGVCNPNCSPGWADCDKAPANGCETDTYQSLNNCGGCGTPCAPQNVLAGVCTQSGCGYSECKATPDNTGKFADCDGNAANGCESDPGSDPANCGGCNKPCDTTNGSPRCNAGVCSISCNTGFADCDQSVATGCETSLNDSALNCGGCRVACPTDHGTPNCVNGVCGTARCEAGFGDCNASAVDLCETDLNTDVLNCGDCGTRCVLPHATPKCIDRACVVAACDVATANTPAYGDCDALQLGCETPLNTVTDCGGCKVACSPPHAQGECSTGVCRIRVGGCESGYADCNNYPDDGCETSIATSTANCGGCGTVCSSAGGIPSCQSEICRIDCDATHGNCDGNIGNGCETTLTSDPSNCGGCGNICSSLYGTPGCSGGACTIRCNPGYDDCDHTAATGCEVNLTNNVNNCGACGTVCSLPNAVAQCSGGGCVISVCNAGYKDCNNNPADGCEVNTNTDILHCGTCTTTCSVAHGAPLCSSGVCTVGGCNTGWGDCNAVYGDGCEANLLTDPSNCSRCGSGCTAISNGTPGCSAGACTVATCNAGFKDCDGTYANGCEKNIYTDVSNCGTCGTICTVPHGSPTCTGTGTCAVGGCDSGYANCDGLYGNGCEVNTESDPNHCGSCPTVCTYPGGTPTCVGHVCGGSATTCTDPKADCNGSAGDGCEVNLSIDEANCGSCGHACAFANASADCASKACVMTCNTGWDSCDGDATNGCETNTNTNPARCGSCTNACSVANGTPACASGVCSVAGCNSGRGNCDGQYATGCEVNFSSDGAHCGNCTTACTAANGTASCTSGSCGVATCNSGYANCDGQYANGCEVNSSSDVAHCGNCTTACTVANGSPRCTSGACGILSCNAGYGNCDTQYSTGCEVALNTVTNCGACGVACTNAHGTTTCNGTACVPTCQSGWASCDNVAANGCETALGTTTNCASCGNACSFPHAVPACVSNACAISSCSAGYDNCDGVLANGCETNLNTSTASCGACGVGCSNAHGTTTCSNGACAPTCNAGWADCNDNANDGCETDLTASTSCGVCGNNCTIQFANAAGSCVGGQCVPGDCNPGFANCDGIATNGCEANTQTNTQNCGACGSVCNTTQHVTSASCVTGGCVLSCASGYGSCDNIGTGTNGCEADLTNDFNHCGICTTACTTGQTCTGGSCLSRPCTGLCQNPTLFTLLTYQSGNLGTAATCYETMTAIHGVVCGNLSGGRTLDVNTSTAWTCDGAAHAAPAARNGGFCIRTTAGDYSWAYFNTY